MAAIHENEPDRDDPRGAILALVEAALSIADKHGFTRVGIYLDQARISLSQELHQGPDI